MIFDLLGSCDPFNILFKMTKLVCWALTETKIFNEVTEYVGTTIVLFDRAYDCSVCSPGLVRQFFGRHDGQGCNKQYIFLLRLVDHRAYISDLDIVAMSFGACKWRTLLEACLHCAATSKPSLSSLN